MLFTSLVPLTVQLVIPVAPGVIGLITTEEFPFDRLIGAPLADRTPAEPRTDATAAAAANNMDLPFFMILPSLIATGDEFFELRFAKLFPLLDLAMPCLASVTSVMFDCWM